MKILKLKKSAVMLITGFRTYEQLGEEYRL